MPQPDDFAAVIPCLNEGRTIAAVVRGVRALTSRVIVVDDGSTDTTAATAAAVGARVVRHPRNRGKGAALRTGISLAAQLGCRWAATLDGDGQHAPEDLIRLRERAEATGAALVIGDRLSGGAPGMPWVRRLANRWMSRRLSLRAGVPMADTQSGLRWIALDAWQRLELRTHRFEIESETVLAFARAGCRLEFVPVAARPSLRPSHIRPLRDTWRWVRWWWDLPRGPRSTDWPGAAGRAMRHGAGEA